jgi:NTE family protein
MTSTSLRVATTPHARREYLADAQRDGIALCLSGGGFRAALFHLGAVRRLYEIGLLDRVRTIAATSGGTVLSAFLAARCEVWRHQGLSTAEWERSISVPFRSVASKNLNTIPILVGWLPWNWMNNAGLDAMADACEARGITRQTTADLPHEPEFLFGATDLVSGDGFLFERANLIPRRIATAIAVSSCFPGFFRPFSESAPERIALVDGGVRDDRSVEPVWRTHRHLLISDGGDVLRPEWGESVFWSLFRSAAVLFNESQVVQKRWLISNFLAGQLEGTYWSIDSSPLNYLQRPDADAYFGYTPALARDVIAAIRTDYDAFSSAEAAVLENHGYFMAEAAARAHLEDLDRCSAPLAAPHPAWMSEAKVREALRNSAQKRFLGRW